MRITAQKKEETRRRILDCARKLFSDRGFDPTTTRDIAEAAGIAAGTLFNYFPSKEALAMTIVELALDEGAVAFEDRTRGDETLEEALFAHIAYGLRYLEPHRHYIGDVLDLALSPFAGEAICPQARQFRVNHLETVRELIGSHSPPTTPAPTLITMHLYWTLYLGVLSFWATDESPNREDTLVVLDQSTELFAQFLSSELKNGREVNDVTDVARDS